MPFTDLDVLRLIHSKGNVATHEQLWTTVRRLILAEPENWPKMVRSMVDRGLITAEFSGGRPVQLTLQQPGMDLITASLHICDPQWCRPLGSTASS